MLFCKHLASSGGTQGLLQNQETPLQKSPSHEERLVTTQLFKHFCTTAQRLVVC